MEDRTRAGIFIVIVERAMVQDRSLWCDGGRPAVLWTITMDGTSPALLGLGEKCALSARRCAQEYTQIGGGTFPGRVI